MNEETLLHTAARRYCEDRALQWRLRYAECGPQSYREGYTDEAKDIFPRYLVLGAILVEIERLRPETFTSVPDAKDMLVLAGQVAESDYNSSHDSDIEQKAMQEARDLYCAYVTTLDSEALRHVLPMPFRHTLTEAESESLWERVKRRWGMSGSFWWPLSGDAPPDTAAFNAGAFHEHIPNSIFQNLLKEHGLLTVFELLEFGTEYELEISLVDPVYYGAAEGYWTSSDMDWMVYASHENTVTVAGDWLLRAVKQRWPTWADHLVTWC